MITVENAAESAAEPARDMSTSPTKTAKPRVDRRTGLDRRQTDQEPPGKRDRRRFVEPRKPEVQELELSDSEWQALTRGSTTPPT